MSRQRTTSPRGGAGFVRHIRLDLDAPTGEYPFNLPAVAWLARAGGLSLAPGVTFL